MPVEIFVSYSHYDKKYLKDNSLLGHLLGLEKDGARFWYDQKINAGELWNETIEDEISKADVALVLVSQMFLRSKYCMEKEITAFLERHRESGMLIFPVILSDCDWKQYDWLASRQFLPSEGKTIEYNYTNSGKRKKIFQEILENLRLKINEIKNSAKKSKPTQAIKSASDAVNTINKIVPEVVDFSNNRPPTYLEYGLVFEGNNKIISAKRHGRIVKVITAAELENLPKRQLDHINIFQQSLEKEYAKWNKLYTRQQNQKDTIKKEAIDKEMREVVANMRESLDRIFAFLTSAGLQLDDHYLEFREVVETESRKANNNSQV